MPLAGATCDSAAHRDARPPTAKAQPALHRVSAHRTPYSKRPRSQPAAALPASPPPEPVALFDASGQLRIVVVSAMLEHENASMVESIERAVQQRTREELRAKLLQQRSWAAGTASPVSRRAANMSLSRRAAAATVPAWYSCGYQRAPNHAEAARSACDRSLSTRRRWRGAARRLPREPMRMTETPRQCNDTTTTSTHLRSSLRDTLASWVSSRGRSSVHSDAAHVAGCSTPCTSTSTAAWHSRRRQ